MRILSTLRLNEFAFEPESELSLGGFGVAGAVGEVVFNA